MKFQLFFVSLSSKMTKLLRLGNKNKQVCFVFRSTFRNFVRILSFSSEPATIYDSSSSAKVIISLDTTKCYATFL